MDNNSNNQEYINIIKEHETLPPHKSSLEPRHSNFFMMIVVLGAIFVPLIGFLILGFIGGFIGTFSPGFDIMAEIPIWAMQLGSQIFVFAVPCAIYLIVKRKHIRELLPLRRLGWRNVLMIIVMTLAMIPMISLVGTITQLVFPDIIGEFAENVLYQGGFLILMLIFAFVAPVFEEVAFRGIGFAGFRHINIRKAAIINGLVFGFLHMNMNQFSYAFLVGIILCYLMYYTKSIWAPILSHFVVNFFAAMMTFILSMTNQEYDDILQYDMYYGFDPTLWAIISLGIISTVTMTVFIAVYIQFKSYNLHRNEAEGIVTDTAKAAREAGYEPPKAATWSFWVTAVGFALIMLLFYLI